jgi:uncharacterized protein
MAVRIAVAALTCLWCCGLVAAAEVIPPLPNQYFNDYAHVVSPSTAGRLNSTLEDFERTTSSQILVAVYPKMESDSSIEDYTVRVAQSWKAGQKSKNNGAVLFVFIQNRTMYLQVGYGLEGALPDALAKRIIEQEIKPHFRNGDYDGGLSAGVAAILAATKGEYTGSGRTLAEQGRRISSAFAKIILVVILLVLVFLSRRNRGSGLGYASSGWILGGGGFSGGGGWGGGGGGGGGGFSGGGGSFGGGGAGGSW